MRAFWPLYHRRVETIGRFIRLMHRPGFNRMVRVRLCTQGADTAIQVGMASYLLFNPQNQPNAWAVAGVIALVTLPFTIVGPFISPALDRHWRTTTVLVSDAIRLGYALAMALAIGSNLIMGRWQLVLYILLLVALSLNRLQLAAHTAGLPHVVAKDEYLEASSVVPMIGPSAAVLFGVLTGTLRVVTGRWLTPWQADGLIFGLAALLLAGGMTQMRGFQRPELGPEALDTLSTLAKVMHDLGAGAKHLWDRRPVAIAFTVLFASRIGYGMWMCIVVVAHRHHFDPQGTGILGVGLWFIATGIGFALSGLLATPLGNALGVRRSAMILMLGCLGASAIPLLVFTPLMLVVSGFGYGMCTQGVKICSDTIVQAQVADEVRGRVIVLYDIVNNLGIAAGTVVAAMILPASGYSPPVLAGLVAWLGLASGWFTLVTRRQDATYDQGTKRGARD